MILVPPLGPPDHITGEREILTSAPDNKWTAMLARGYDRAMYDFVDEKDCDLARALEVIRLDQVGMKLPGFADSKCVRDDGRHHIVELK